MTNHKDHHQDCVAKHEYHEHCIIHKNEDNHTHPEKHDHCNVSYNHSEHCKK